MTPGRGPLVPTLWLVHLLLVAWAAGCGAPGDAGAKITSFEPPSGTLRSGEPATSSVRFENTGDEERTFWAGYGVRDGAGRWHDAPGHPVRLKTGEESGNREVTTGPLATAGPYEARVSVWEERPGGDGATRLANAARPDAVVVAETGTSGAGRTSPPSTRSSGRRVAKSWEEDVWRPRTSPWRTGRCASGSRPSRWRAASSSP